MYLVDAILMDKWTEGDLIFLQEVIEGSALEQTVGCLWGERG